MLEENETTEVEEEDQFFNTDIGKVNDYKRRLETKKRKQDYWSTTVSRSNILSGNTGKSPGSGAEPREERIPSFKDSNGTGK